MNYNQIITPQIPYNKGVIGSDPNVFHAGHTSSGVLKTLTGISFLAAS